MKGERWNMRGEKEGERKRERRIGSEKGRKIYRKIDFELISY